MGFEDYFIYVSPYLHSATAPMADSGRWAEDVNKALEKILASRVGGAVLRSIRFHQIPVWIRPESFDRCNASTIQIDAPVNTLTVSPDRTTSLRSGITIWFSPGVYSATHRCHAAFAAFDQIPMEAHEVLLHELVHALRMVSFKANPTIIQKGLINFDSNEELYAVLVQGIYASEHKTKIRSSHFGHFEIDPALNGSLAFFRTGTEMFSLVDRFCRDNPGFTRAINCINVGFNPINAYYMKPSVAALMSRSDYAKKRDKSAPLMNAVVLFIFEQAGRIQRFVN